MTREGYKKWKKVIKEFAKGKEVQVLYCGRWLTTTHPSFNHGQKYRIKPKEEIKLEPNGVYEFEQKELWGQWEYIGITTLGTHVFMNHAKTISFDDPLKYISKRVK